MEHCVLKGKWLFSIKGRTCNPTLPVYHDMRKKFFMKQISRDNTSEILDRVMVHVY